MVDFFRSYKGNKQNRVFFFIYSIHKCGKKLSVLISPQLGTKINLDEIV